MKRLFYSLLAVAWLTGVGFAFLGSGGILGAALLGLGWAAGRYIEARKAVEAPKAAAAATQLPINEVDGVLLPDPTDPRWQRTEDGQYLRLGHILVRLGGYIKTDQVIVADDGKLHCGCYPPTVIAYCCKDCLQEAVLTMLGKETGSVAIDGLQLDAPDYQRAVERAFQSRLSEASILELPSTQKALPSPTTEES